MSAPLSNGGRKRVAAVCEVKRKAAQQEGSASKSYREPDLLPPFPPAPLSACTCTYRNLTSSVGVPSPMALERMPRTRWARANVSVYAQRSPTVSDFPHARTSGTLSPSFLIFTDADPAAIFRLAFAPAPSQTWTGDATRRRSVAGEESSKRNHARPPGYAVRTPAK